MNFYKTSILTTLYTIFNMVSGLIITKVTATLIGPIGTAYIGEFGNVVVILSLISTASIGTGIVKYVSEYKNDTVQLKKLINTSFGLILLCSIPLSILIILLSGTLCEWTFHRSDFKIVFILLGILLVIISLYQITISVLSGMQQIKLLTYVNMIAAGLNLMITIYLVYQWNIIGALLSNILFNSLITICSLPALKKLGLLSLEFFTPKIEWDLGKKLIKFGVYGAVSSLGTMVALLIIRNTIAHHHSLQEAGLWQGMYSLSDRYLSIINAIIGVYYLPKLAELNEAPQIIREVRKGFKRILPLATFMSITIFFCRDLIISILLAESFRPMRELFAFQLIGDVLKVAAALFGNLVFARAMIRTGLKVELIYLSFYTLSSILLIKNFGVVGATYAFALSALVLFLMYSYFFKDLIVQIKKSVLPKPWLK